MLDSKRGPIAKRIKRRTLLSSAAFTFLGSRLVQAQANVPPSVVLPPSQLSAQEQLLHAVARISFTEGDVIHWGTGFLCSFLRNGQTHTPCFVTNRHVRAAASKGNISFNRLAGNPRVTSAPPFNLDISGYVNNWIDHPDKNVDLSLLPLNPEIVAHKADFDGLAMTFIGTDYIPTIDFVQNLDVVENVLFVGYPAGAWDTFNNLPVFRRGTTASPPYMNFRGQRQTLLDASIWDGSSGSPVFLIDEGEYVDKHKGMMLGANRVSFLGVIQGVYKWRASDYSQEVAQGEATEKLTGTYVDLPDNLGLMIHSSCLLDFEPELIKLGAVPPPNYKSRSTTDF